MFSLAAKLKAHLSSYNTSCTESFYAGFFFLHYELSLHLPQLFRRMLQRCSGNVLWNKKHNPTIHRHEGDKITAERYILGELILKEQYSSISDSSYHGQHIEHTVLYDRYKLARVHSRNKLNAE